MAKIGIFFGSTTGHTETVAGLLSQELENFGMETAVHNIGDGDLQAMNGYENLILAIPTWNVGELQEDWENIYDDFARLDFSGKRVAFVGLGDATGYPAYFVDAMDLLARPVEVNNGQVVGYWPVKEYDYAHSTATRGEHFVGLVIDEDNEDGLTQERLRKWAKKLSKEFTA